MNKLFYAASTGGFYNTEIHGEKMPSDKVEISAADYEGLMAAQADGKLIVPNEAGRPMAIDAPPMTPDEEKTLAQKRRAGAYSSEADPIFFKAQRGEATMAEWEAKVAEIKARYPYPGE